MKKSLLFPVLLAAVYLPASSCVPSSADVGDSGEPMSSTRNLLSGTIEGRVSDDGEVHVYKSIPFVGPPIGDLRWQPPQSVEPWDGTLAATEFSPACMQVKRPATSFYGPGADAMSEDCLYLNVWSAAQNTAERRPVMVWIHGGGLRNGHGGRPSYDGDALARRGVVLVTVNYRLGVLGFLAHPALSENSDRGISGNYGLLDQIAALEWVRDNIATFGGDASRVTIFGESAGSLAVNYLQASPLAAGLFHGVIGESGSALRSTPYLEQDGGQGPSGHAAGLRFSKALLGDQEATSDALRGASTERVMAAFQADGVAFPSRCYVDGWFLPDTVWNLFDQARQNDVPVIVGWNADEGPSLAGSRGPHTLAEYQAYAKSTYGELADDFLTVYPAHNDSEARASYLKAFGTATFGWGSRAWSRLQQAASAPIYQYHFERVPPGDRSEEYGAYHAAEIVYVFDNLDSSSRPWEEEDRRLSDAMASYWVNFATTGDPNGEALAEWPAYSAENDASMAFGDALEVRSGLRSEELDFFDRVASSRNAE